MISINVKDSKLYTLVLFELMFVEKNMWHNNSKIEWNFVLSAENWCHRKIISDIYEPSNLITNYIKRLEFIFGSLHATSSWLSKECIFYKHGKTM